MAELEFRTWSEGWDGGPVYAGDSYDDAYAAMRTSARQDIDRHGEQEVRATAVMHPYGHHIQVFADGEDVTQQFMLDNPNKPLELPDAAGGWEIFRG